MGRKVSIGIVGSGGGLGTIIAGGSGNTLSTAVSNQDLIIDPNGSGSIRAQSDLFITDQQSLRLVEGAGGGGTNYIGMRAAATMSANYTVVWPAAVAGTTGFVLSSDTSGNLSWVSAGGAISVSDSGSVGTVHYPLFGTNAGAIPSSLAPLARSNLTFVPSTGELGFTIGTVGTVRGSTGSSATLTIQGTSNATKATASVLMTDGVASTTTTTGTLVVTGGVGISGQLTAATLVETSSIAFKENVNPIENALDSILQLVGVTYDRKDTGQHEAGLIAEDVYNVIPGIVSKDVNGNPYGLQYTKLTAYLIESIKALKQEINELKGR
jgi:hypothetical protein